MARISAKAPLVFLHVLERGELTLTCVLRCAFQILGDPFGGLVGELTAISLRLRDTYVRVGPGVRPILFDRTI